VTDHVDPAPGRTEKQLIQLINRLHRNRFEPLLIPLVDLSDWARLECKCETIVLRYHGFTFVGFISSVRKSLRIIRKMRFQVNWESFYQKSATHPGRRRFASS
jgi:hypothetical protein